MSKRKNSTGSGGKTSMKLYWVMCEVGVLLFYLIALSWPHIMPWATVGILVLLWALGTWELSLDWRHSLALGCLLLGMAILLAFIVTKG